jgi:hypothetical protein
MKGLGFSHHVSIDHGLLYPTLQKLDPEQNNDGPCWLCLSTLLRSRMLWEAQMLHWKARLEKQKRKW